MIVTPEAVIATHLNQLLVKHAGDLIGQDEVQDLLDNLHMVYSREATEKRYVQDVIQTQIDTIISDLENGAVIMICGAIAMQNAVFSILEEALSKRNQALSFYEKRNQILVDCY